MAVIFSLGRRICDEPEEPQWIGSGLAILTATDPLQTFITIKLKGRLYPVPVNEANNLTALLCTYYCPLSIAFWIIGATASLAMSRSRQYLDCSQVDNFFCPLLALQEQQQSAIFSRVIILASFIMCSQLAHVFFETLAGVKFSPQYTHCLSLSRTSFSSQCGIFQLFVMRLPCAPVHNDRLRRALSRPE